MLINARSILIIGVDFQKAHASAETIQRRFKEALYEEVENYSVQRGIPNNEADDTHRNTGKILLEIKDLQLLGDLGCSLRVVKEKRYRSYVQLCDCTCQDQF